MKNHLSLGGLKRRPVFRSLAAGLVLFFFFGLTAPRTAKAAALLEYSVLLGVIAAAIITVVPINSGQQRAYDKLVNSSYSHVQDAFNDGFIKNDPTVELSNLSAAAGELNAGSTIVNGLDPGLDSTLAQALAQTKVLKAAALQRIILGGEGGTCGNGVIDTGESCDPGNPGTAICIDGCCSSVDCTCQPC